MTRQARYFALAVVALIGVVVALMLEGEGDSRRPCPLTPTECKEPEEAAPDPGGNEAAALSTPPRGIAFGFNESPEVEGVDQARLEDLARIAGANARRFPLDWRLLEPRRDVWNEGGWLYYQRTYEAILAASMTPVINFGFAPAWARDPGPARTCANFFACRYPPARAMAGEWREFAAEVARRFPRAVLEVWNEPNLAIFWRPGPDPERFAELQAIAYDAIKAVSPEAVVLAGGLAANGERESRVAPTVPGDIPLRDFLERALTAEPSIGGHMDGLSFHPYPYGEELGRGSTFAKGFRDVRAELAAHGETDRPLWITETGIASDGNFAVDEETQGHVLARLVRRLATMPDVDGVLLHRLVPPATEPSGSTEHGYALLRSPRPPFIPKPAYCALADMAENSYPGC